MFLPGSPHWCVWQSGRVGMDTGLFYTLHPVEVTPSHISSWDIVVPDFDRSIEDLEMEFILLSIWHMKWSLKSCDPEMNETAFDELSWKKVYYALSEFRSSNAASIRVGARYLYLYQGADFPVPVLVRVPASQEQEVPCTCTGWYLPG